MCGQECGFAAGTIKNLHTYLCALSTYSCHLPVCFICLQVLAQQRAEQSRLASEANRENPDMPTDPETFFQSLGPSLRQQVLADLDDSQVAILPADLAAEASVLRREMEDRHRRLVQERLFAQGAGLLSGILRQSGGGIS